MFLKGRVAPDGCHVAEMGDPACAYWKERGALDGKQFTVLAAAEAGRLEAEAGRLKQGGSNREAAYLAC